MNPERPVSRGALDLSYETLHVNSERLYAKRTQWRMLPRVMAV